MNQGNGLFFDFLHSLNDILIIKPMPYNAKAVGNFVVSGKL